MSDMNMDTHMNMSMNMSEGTLFQQGQRGQRGGKVAAEACRTLHAGPATVTSGALMLMMPLPPPSCKPFPPPSMQIGLSRRLAVHEVRPH